MPDIPDKMKPQNQQRRIWPHIVLIWFVMAFLDSATTYIGLRWFGGRELNPHIDTSSLGAFLLRGSVIFAIVCALCILSERHLRPEISRMAESSSFDEFSKKINKTWRAVPWFIMRGMYMLGLCRIAVVASNSTYIILGFSPIELASQFLSGLLGVTQQTAIILLLFALMLIIDKPAHKSLYRRIRNNEPDGTTAEVKV